MAAAGHPLASFHRFVSIEPVSASVFEAIGHPTTRKSGVCQDRNTDTCRIEQLENQSKLEILRCATVALNCLKRVFDGPKGCHPFSLLPRFDYLVSQLMAGKSEVQASS